MFPVVPMVAGLGAGMMSTSDGWLKKLSPVAFLGGSLFSDDGEEEAKEQKKKQERAMAAEDFDGAMQRLFQNMSTLSQFVASGNQNRANAFGQFMGTRMGGMG